MFDPVIIFSTITLIILIGAAFWLKIPKLSVPLVGVYVVFLFFSVTEKKTNNPVMQAFSQPDLVVDETKVIPIIDDSPDSIYSETPKVKQIELKPIVFKDDTNLFKDSLKKETPSQTIIPKEPEAKDSSIKIKQIAICKNIRNRKPIQSGQSFSSSVDSLFCYTLLSNPGGKEHLTHIWEYDNKIMSKIRYSVKHSENWRSWTRKTILPHQVGLWTVSVENSSGEIIRKIQFTIFNEHKE